MIKNILIYIAILAASFSFMIFYYAWFSSFLFTVVLCLPVLSLVCSLPFMIYAAVKGFTIYAPKISYADSDLGIGVAANGNNGFFCPLVKILIRTKNSFSGKSKNFAFQYSGIISKPVGINISALGKSCGCIEAETKWFKVYDMLGIFFIPVRFKNRAEILVVPSPQNASEDILREKQTIIGYKKKSGGGFADDYEIREYQNGDSLRNVHWKLSAKYDNLMVREPSLPIYKNFKIMLMLTDNPQNNDKVLARFANVCKSAINNGVSCAVSSTRSQGAFPLTPDTDIYSMYKALYTQKNLGSADIHGSAVCNIFADGEEVAE